MDDTEPNVTPSDEDGDFDFDEVPEGFRSGFVAIVGRPNVGKSTLMNQIVGEKVAIATPKPQTTRDRIRGVRTWEDWQVCYVDTPGIHEAKTRLNRYMVELAISTLSEVDLAYLLVDSLHMERKPETVLRETEGIIESIREAGTKTLLVLNKVDKLEEKEALLPMIEQLSALFRFEEIVPLSAKTGKGVDPLLELTRPLLPEGPPLFPEDTLTDKSVRFLSAEMIREQLFFKLQQELPYQLAVSVDAFGEREDGLVVIQASIHVGRKSHKAMVIGKRGHLIKEIGQGARRGIERLLDRRVFLDLHVRVEEGWIDRARGLAKFGYDEL